MTMSRGPGRWQRAILEALERLPVLTLGDLARSAAELSAAHRAARRLAARGLCDTGLLYTDDPDGGGAAHGRRLVTAVCRPGVVFKDGRTLKELSVQRVPAHGTRSTFKGSLRHIAAQEGVSVTQVRRDLGPL
jgi:hypothetical protein